jgi:hypothetical protein
MACDFWRKYFRFITLRPNDHLSNPHESRRIDLRLGNMLATAATRPVAATIRACSIVSQPAMMAFFWPSPPDGHDFLNR